MSEVKFTACKNLCFEDKYAAKKQVLGDGKVFWLREVADNSYPSMVQFCKLRGRLNNPEACTANNQAICGHYEEVTHTVQVGQE